MSHKNQLSNILKEENITNLFQPIVSLKTGDIIGYEAFGRGPMESMLHNPLDLLDIAAENNKHVDLELVLKKNAIEKLKQLMNNFLLFINVDSNTLCNISFIKNLTNKLLNDYDIFPSSIILELTERMAIDDYCNCKSILQYCCSQGYRIAIDNVGALYSGMKTIKEIRPHFLKIDKDFIKDIDKDTFKQAIVSSFVSLSTATNIKLIAKSIETKEELETLIRLGVYAGQGYFLQKPDKTLSDIPIEIRNIILKYNDFLNSSFIHSNLYDYIGSIMEKRNDFDISTPCCKIKDFFDKNNIDSACITANESPVGLIMGHTLDSNLAQHYGIALYYNRPISLIMDYSPLVVDYYTPINIVSEQAMARPDKNTYDHIIVTKNSKYFGIVSVKKLLQYAISFERNYARELNPLTQLPGNVIINRVLKDAITLNKESCILYFDLDNFKVYNDYYGFENGDKVIKLTASIIHKNVKNSFPYTSFVGHIGGDDFVSLIECRIEDCETLCKEIISEFDSSILDYFNERDRQNRYIVGEDRNGKLKTFNLTSLSIAGFYGNPNKFTSVDKLAQFVTIIKKDVKKIKHSSYIINKLGNSTEETYNIC